MTVFPADRGLGLCCDSQAAPSGYLQVCVLSAVGPFRKGKSFLLNVFLRYLSSIGSNTNAANWLETAEPLTGFVSARGTDGVTSGMDMWAHPFEVTLESGEEVVVLIIDTQGIFDQNASKQASDAVFALSLLIASTTVSQYMHVRRKSSDVSYENHPCFSSCLPPV